MSIAVVSECNQTTTYSYDAVGRETGRETGREYADGTRVTITYDPAGNRTLLEDWTGAYTFTYDDVNRVATAAAPTGTLTYDYDQVGRRKTLTDPDGGIFTYTRDLAGRLTQSENPDAEVTTLGYDDAGRNAAKELDNGTSAALEYDAAGYLERVTHLDATSTTLSSFAYGFDGAGRRTDVTDAGGGSSNWAYGCTGQLGGDFYFTAAGGWATLTLSQWTLLTEADWETLPVEGSTAVYARVSAYDPAGNRLTLTDPDTAAVTTNTYDAANRLLTSEDANGVTTYTYDANGNQLTIEEPTGDVTTNVWDGENRLVAVEHPDFSITIYAYNADGLKVEKDDGVAVTRFLYDGNNLLRELDDLGTVEAEFTYVPQPYAHLVSQQRDGDSSFYHFDGTRNTAALSDAASVTTAGWPS